MLAWHMLVPDILLASLGGIMSEGHSAAIVGFAAMGVTYLVVESIVTFLVLGLAFGALAVIVMAVSIIGYIAKHPIRTARGWTLFLGGSGTALVLPFLFMFFAVMRRHTEVSSTNMSGAQDIGSLVAFGWLLATIFWAVPTLYEHFEQQDRGL
ncbi:hypothetical protein NGB36_03460 [Streptomyces sp. RB6PN25]|uniref:Uncharacterized protein n=1 Tax=Streptomyces humicola TaxID=2953240 RepID=A0ABT1PPT1_9ACTN|nr:hypothetical protein [Streptomyces humicola]MCQ4079679.1 hypothetical protein [Streptomyces humicola]